MATKLIHIDMIRRDVLFHFGDAHSLCKELRKYHKKEVIDEIVDNPPKAETNSGRTIYKSDPYVMIVWLPCVPTTIDMMDTLSHEIFHATVALMNSIGASLSVESEETYAYLIGYLTNRVLSDFHISFQPRMMYNEAKAILGISEQDDEQDY